MLMTQADNLDENVNGDTVNASCVNAIAKWITLLPAALAQMGLLSPGRVEYCSRKRASVRQDPKIQAAPRRGAPKIQAAPRREDQQEKQVALVA